MTQAERDIIVRLARESGVNPEYAARLVADYLEAPEQRRGNLSRILAEIKAANGGFLDSKRENYILEIIEKMAFDRNTTSLRLKPKQVISQILQENPYRFVPVDWGRSGDPYERIYEQLRREREMQLKKRAFEFAAGALGGPFYQTEQPMFVPATAKKNPEPSLAQPQGDYRYVAEDKAVINKTTLAAIFLALKKLMEQAGTPTLHIAAQEVDKYMREPNTCAGVVETPSAFGEIEYRFYAAIGSDAPSAEQCERAFDFEQ